MSTPPDDTTTRPATIAATIHEAGSDAPMPAWVCITAADGSVVEDWKVDTSLPGFPSDGAFRVEVPPGPLRIEVHRLVSHEWVVDEFKADAGQVHERIYELRPWVAPRRRGYYCGESHNHVNYPTGPDRLVRYCRALGIDYVNVCQGWMHKPDPKAHVSGAAMARMLERHSTADCHLHFGAERPKTRYGHVWWWGLEPFDDPYAEYAGWHDSNYFAVSGRITEPVADPRGQYPFRCELPFKTWKRYRDQGAACAAAHPTSWWVTDPQATLVATNISVELPFAVLAGGLIDAMVVMGYDADHIFYQNTWFGLLNEGYALPAVAETDGAMKGHHHIGQLLGYVPTPDGTYSQAGIIDGVRRGRCVMSAGPFVLLTADDGAVQTGDHRPADGRRHTLRIEAWANPRPDEFLSVIVVYRNGKVFRTIDLARQRPRHYQTTVEVADDERAWYVVKVYGSTRPARDLFLDVFAYCELCERETHTEYITDIREVAITNPIFFDPPGWRPPAPVVCDATIRVVRGPRPVPAARVRVLNYDQPLAQLTADADGVVRTTMPPTAEIEVSADGSPTVRKSIFLDYDPVNDLMVECYSGRWRAELPCPPRPGQMPWRFFRLRELRAALQHVDWTVNLDRGA